MMKAEVYNGPVFLSIKGTSKAIGTGETRLRKDVKDGKVPYIMRGSKCLVNVPLYIEQLNKQSAENMTAMN